jgi:hypothetical protein
MHIVVFKGLLFGMYTSSILCFDVRVFYIVFLIRFYLYFVSCVFLVCVFVACTVLIYD